MCVRVFVVATLQCPAAIANGKLPLHLHKFLINQTRTQFFIAYILGQQTEKRKEGGSDMERERDANKKQKGDATRDAVTIFTAAGERFSDCGHRHKYLFYIFK